MATCVITAGRVRSAARHHGPVVLALSFPAGQTRPSLLLKLMLQGLRSVAQALQYDFVVKAVADFVLKVGVCHLVCLCHFLSLSQSDFLCTRHLLTTKSVKQ